MSFINVGIPPPLSSLGVSVNLPSFPNLPLPNLPKFPSLPALPPLPNIPGLATLAGGGLPAIPGLPSIGSLLGAPAGAIGDNASASSDVVGIYDNNTLDQLFWTARPIKVTVMPSKKAMMHPIETGAVNTDFAIVMPVEIDLSVILAGASTAEYQSVYKQIKDAYTNSIFVCIQTRADTYYNMLIVGIPHDETPEMADALSLAIRLRETLVFGAQYQQLPPDAVQTATDQSSLDKGILQPASSALFQAKAGITSAITGAVDVARGLLPSSAQGLLP